MYINNYTYIHIYIYTIIYIGLDKWWHVPTPDTYQIDPNSHLVMIKMMIKLDHLQIIVQFMMASCMGKIENDDAPCF